MAENISMDIPSLASMEGSDVYCYIVDGELNESSALFYYKKAIRLCISVYVDLDEISTRILDGEIVDEHAAYDLAVLFNMLLQFSFSLMDLAFQKHPEKISHSLSFFANLQFSNGARIEQGRMVGNTDIAEKLAAKWQNGFPEKTTPFKYNCAIYVQELINRRKRRTSSEVKIA